MLHVDLHGKKDTVNPSKQDHWTIDLGIAPLVECCADPAKTSAAVTWTEADALALKRAATDELSQVLCPTTCPYCAPPPARTVPCHPPVLCPATCPYCAPPPARTVPRHLPVLCPATASPPLTIYRTHYLS